MERFSYAPEVYYPVRTNNPLYHNLAYQCVVSSLPVSYRMFDNANEYGRAGEPTVRFQFQTSLSSDVSARYRRTMDDQWANLQRGRAKWLKHQG